MNIEEFEDFRDDLKEGQLVTLLLHDHTQEIGKIIKIRSSNVKLLLEESGIEVSIGFADIKRVAVGPYNFLRTTTSAEPLYSSQPLNGHTTQPSIKNISQSISAPPPTELRKISSREEILNDLLSDFEERINKISLPEIEIKFSFDAAKYSYAVEKSIRNILCTANQKYKSLNTESDNNLLQIIVWIEERLIKYNNVAELPALVGAMYYKIKLVNQALPYLKAAVHISQSRTDWKNLFIAGADNGELTFFALNNYFELTTVFGIEEDLWLFYIRSILASDTKNLAIKQIYKIYNKINDEKQKIFILHSLIYILNKTNAYKLASDVSFAVYLNDKEAVNDLLTKILNDYQIASEHENLLINSHKYDIINEYERIFNIIKCDIQNNIENIYNRNNSYYDNLYFGYVAEFSSSKRGGFIKSDNSDEKFFFYLDHIEDSDARANIQKGDYNDRLRFFIFTNIHGIKQAKRIRVCNDINIKNYEYLNEKEIEKRAKNAILAGKRDVAISIYREGLKLSGNKNSSVLWTGLAQQLSATGQYEEASHAYKQLSKIEESQRRHSAQKNANIQYVQMLTKSGKTDLAEKEILELLKLYPHDSYLSTLLDNIRFDDLDDGTENSLADWGMDINIEDRSLFLKRELESADFIDNKISRSGGEPTTEDADRLLKDALKPGLSPEARYISSLQAAKAYDQLTEGTYNRDDYLLSLSNYAMQRGEAQVNRMLGLASNPSKAANSQQTLQKLHDSSISYFIESLDRMPENVVEKHAPVIIKNYLLAELLNFYAYSPNDLDSTLLYIDDFDKLFKTIVRKNTNIENIVCDAFITWGSYPFVWKRLSNMLDQLGIYNTTPGETRFRKNIKKKIISFVGQHVENLSFKGILKEGFNYLFEERSKLEKNFKKINDIRQTNTFEFFQKIKKPLDSFPLQNSALLSSDVAVIQRIQKVVNEMMSYLEASPSERGYMLIRARQALNDPERPCLMQEITEAPTYWKRVGCEPLIRELLKCISSMENIRLKESTPKLEITLEPTLFHKEGNNYITSVHIHNARTTSATGVCLELTLKNVKGMDICLPSINIGRVENMQPVEEKLIIPITYDHHHTMGATLMIRATYFEGISEIFEFTLEEDTGCSFDVNSIPWDPMGSVKEANFKGRDGILQELENCLSSESDRVFTNMLYGVTRSGKTSILKFLRQRMHKKEVPNDISGRRFYCIDWRFQLVLELPSSHDVWKTLLYDQVLSFTDEIDKIENCDRDIKLIINSVISDPSLIQADHFIPLVQAMKAGGWYPLFLIDEFSFFSGLYKKNYLGSAFLAVLRELALRKDAAFVIAGTYDILDLVSDPKYGITGQFANLRKVLVTKIEKEPAAELVNIFKDHLQFTDEAQSLIIKLSGCRPFLIQFLCMNCARLANFEKRSLLGIPEVNRVAKMMTGSLENVGGVIRLENNNFDNNLIFTREEMNSIFGAITTLLAIQGNQESGFLSYNEMTAIWKEHDLDVSLLSQGINAMLDREIIEAFTFEEVDGYRLTVDLFRWWWANKHPSLDRELDGISIK